MFQLNKGELIALNSISRFQVVALIFRTIARHEYGVSFPMNVVHHVKLCDG